MRYLSAEQIKNIVPGRMYAAYRRGTLYLSDPESGISGEKNSDPFLTHGLPDDAFCRDKGADDKGGSPGGGNL